MHSHQRRNCSITSINSVGLYSFQTSIFQLFTYIFPNNKPLQRPPLFSCLFPITRFGLYASADFAFFFAERTFFKLLNFSRRFQINTILSRQHQSFSRSLLQGNDKMVIFRSRRLFSKQIVGYKSLFFKVCLTVHNKRLHRRLERRRRREAILLKTKFKKTWLSFSDFQPIIQSGK